MSDTDWFEQACSILGPLPGNYVTVDIETSGLAGDDLPIQIGWGVVLGGQMIDNGSGLIDWTGHVNLDWLSARIARTWAEMESITGRKFDFSPARLRREGTPAFTFLTEFFNMMGDVASSGMTVVCHNGLKLDLLVLNRTGQRYLNRVMPVDKYIDTMVIERALQTRKQPIKGETWKQFCEKHYHAGGSRIKSSLLRHCVPKYKIASTSDRGHEADFDCMITHQLLEAYRNLCPPNLRGLGPSGQLTLLSV